MAALLRSLPFLLALGGPTAVAGLRPDSGKKARSETPLAAVSRQLPPEPAAAAAAEPDSDGDGVPDSADLCPRSKKKGEDDMGIDARGCRISAPRVHVDTLKIRKAESGVLNMDYDGHISGHIAATYKYYRNEAYQCGRYGDFTFAVIEPTKVSGRLAKLWVFLHDFHSGFFRPDGSFVGGEVKNNDEESLGFMRGLALSKEITLKRLSENWRVLILSDCGTDMGLGQGTPDPHNPFRDDAMVHGLQANLAALDFVTNILYPTDEAFVFGQGAGSMGAWPLVLAAASEGSQAFKGAILDSYPWNARMKVVAEKFKGQEGFPFGADWNSSGFDEKIGANQFISIADAVRGGFRKTALLDVYGTQDRFCGGGRDVVAEAAEAGSASNCDWVHGAFRDAIVDLGFTKHRSIKVVDGAHDVVGDETSGSFIEEVEGFITGLMEAREETQVTCGGSALGQTCTFPFTYRNQKYHTCTSVNSRNNRPWCSTTVAYYGFWGYCDCSFLHS